jgi:hypothetical protein
VERAPAAPHDGNANDVPIREREAVRRDCYGIWKRSGTRRVRDADREPTLKGSADKLDL